MFLLTKGPNIVNTVRNALQKSTLRNLSITYQIQNGREVIDGISLYWEKYGNGPHTVLCLPGLGGYISANFHPVWAKMDPSKFTLVGWDPPGNGRSYPPEKKFFTNEFFLTQEARMVNKLMSKLGYEDFSVAGWSNGGVTAFILAGLEPSRIKKTICSNAAYGVTVRTVKVLKAMEDLTRWQPDLRKQFVDFYGEAYLKKILRTQLEYTQQEKIQQDYYGDFLKYSGKIQCPALLLTCLKDPFHDPERAAEIRNSIKTCRHVEFSNYGHNHLEFLDDFVRAIVDFLDE